MNAEQQNILVVDDDEAMRNLLKRILEKAGYHVATAADGMDALYKASLGEGNVVLLDIKMPGMSGMEVLSKLVTESSDYCVIMMTAVADMQTAVDAFKLGAYDYITKPFDAEGVKEKVRIAIEKWHRQTKDRQRYLQLSKSFTEQTQRTREQFEELVLSLAREYKLLYKFAARQPDGGKSMLSKLPDELREPISSIEGFRDALLKILKRS